METIDIVKLLRNIFKQNTHTPEESQNRDDVNLVGMIKDEYPSAYEDTNLTEIEWDTMNDEFFSQSAQITPATILPNDWVWVDYIDGSGALQSPDKKCYFSYDLQTGEYERNDDRMSFWELPMSLSVFKGFAESEIYKTICE